MRNVRQQGVDMHTTRAGAAGATAAQQKRSAEWAESAGAWATRCSGRRAQPAYSASCTDLRIPHGRGHRAADGVCDSCATVPALGPRRVGCACGCSGGCASRLAPLPRHRAALAGSPGHRLRTARRSLGPAVRSLRGAFRAASPTARSQRRARVGSRGALRAGVHACHRGHAPEQLSQLRSSGASAAEPTADRPAGADGMLDSGEPLVR